MSLSVTKEEIFKYHLGGKIGLDLLKELRNQKDLSLAYTPGVSEICKTIQKDASKAWSLTAKGNLVAIVTDGTAVLGLGNIGAKASIPVMEGKAVLFKAFSGISGWPVPLENMLDNDELKELIEFYKNYIGELEDELEDKFNA